MDIGVMSDTRKLLGKIKYTREELGKKDGKTKDRVETWRKNIHNLTGDLKKQVGILENLDNGDETQGAGGDNRRDYFSMLIAKLQKDIEDNVRICQKVMTLNMKKTTNKE